MLYRWPQGRIIRTVCMVLVAVIGVDLGWFAYQQWIGWGRGSGGTSFLVYSIVFSVLTLAVFAVGFGLAGFHQRSSQFLIDVEKEMAKVTWPTRAEIVRFTIVIAIMTVVLSFLVYIVDVANYFLIHRGLFSGQGGG